MIRNLYPFSTIDGKVIPLDIIRPLGILRIPFSAVATPLIDLGIGTPIMSLSASASCFVRFGAQAIVPSAQPIVSNEVFIEVGTVMVVAPHNQNMSVISDGTDGVLTIQLIDQWTGLASETNYRR